MDLSTKRDGNKADVSVSIIILTLNNLPCTINCLDSILETRPEGMDLELIIIDNGSIDGTVQYLEHFENRMIEIDGPKVELSFNQKNHGFAGGCNLGYRMSTKDVVVFLNNDTIVTPGWLEELIIPLMYCPEAAFVASVSNFAGGQQMIQTNYNGRAEMLAFAAKHLQEYNRQTISVGMVTGLCMAARRETLDKLVGFHAPKGQLFDERFFPGMWEDNDICLRATLLNYRCLVSLGSFVHHEGSQSFKALGANVPSETFKVNRQRFYDKWQDEYPKENKVVAMLRVKDGIIHIERCLSGLEKWVDEIVVLDTGSTDGTKGIIGLHLPEHGGKVVDFDFTTFKDSPLQEFEERQYLLEMAQERNPTWILRIDVDEVFEDRILDKLPLLLNPINPEILCWQFPMKTLWRGEEKYRADGNWGQMCPYALFRHIPGQELLNNEHPQGFHIPSIPIFVARHIGFCNVNMVHWGYYQWEEVIRKFEWYGEVDTEKRRDDIGGRGDYSHLVDERTLRLYPYRSMNGISLLIMMKDEENAVLEILEQLHMIVDEIIIVHTGEGISLENKAKFQRYDARICPYRWQDNYAVARNYGLVNCTKRWILALDPDERVAEKHRGMITGLVEQEASGFIFTILNYMEDPNLFPKPKCHAQDAVRLFLNDNKLYYANMVHETLDDSIRNLPEDDPGILRCPAIIHHYGYLQDKDVLKGKLEYYADLNRAWIKKDPEDPRPYYNLAIHYLELGKHDEALNYLEISRDLNNEKQYGLWQVNAALSAEYGKAYIGHTLATIKAIPPDHPFKKDLLQIVNFLKGRIHTPIKVLEEKNGSGNSTGDECAVVDQPADSLQESGKGGDQSGKPGVQEEHQSA